MFQYIPAKFILLLYNIFGKDILFDVEVGRLLIAHEGTISDVNKQIISHLNIIPLEIIEILINSVRSII